MLGGRVGINAFQVFPCLLPQGVLSENQISDQGPHISVEFFVHDIQFLVEHDSLTCKVISESPRSEFFRLELFEYVRCDIIRLSILFLQPFILYVLICDLLSLRQLGKLKLHFSLFVQLLKRCLFKLRMIVRLNSMLFAEGASHLLQVLLVVISLAELSEARYGYTKPIFSCFFPL